MLSYSVPVPGVIHTEASNQFELTNTFVRLQEFYESPYDTIRGRWGFTVNELAATYIADGKEFDYFTKWNGMNVPGHIVEDFFGHFADLSPGERTLNAMLWRALRDMRRPFYLIGTHRDEDISHEIAHAMYYLNKDYKAHMRWLMGETNPYAVKALTSWLLDDREYSATVLDDELQAYLATSPLKYLQEKIGPEDGKAIFDAGAGFRTAFKEFTGKEPI